MTSEEILKIARTAQAETIIQHSELLDIFIDYFFEILKEKQIVKDNIEHDATIIFQMVLSKILHIKQLLVGVNYIDKNNIELLNNLVDPTVIAVLVRNLFETIGMFNIIYIQTNKSEERHLVHALWQIAGLSYRQRFKEIANRDENKLKAKQEELIIEKNEK